MGAGYWLLKSIVPIVVCFIFYLLRVIGAADIKLFSIISSYYSISFCFHVMILSLAVGAFFATAKMFLNHSFFVRLRYFAEYIKIVIAERRLIKYYDKNVCGKDEVIPFTICISLAVIICMGG